MNSYYTYLGMELWDKGYWEQVLPMDNLGQWLGQIDSLREAKHFTGTMTGVSWFPSGSQENWEMEELRFWDERGMNLELHHIWVAKWISLVPKTAVRNSGILLPTILCLHQRSIQNPAWAAETMQHYRALGEEAAKAGRILIISVTDGPDVTRQYPNILMEAASLYPVDYNRVALDVSSVYESGHTLADLPGGVSNGSGGILADPDNKVVSLGGYKLLDVSALWRSTGSPNWGQLVGPDGHNAGNSSYDCQRFIHTLAAQRLVEPLRLEHTYKNHMEQELFVHWAQMGLRYDTHKTNYERWITLTPQIALDKSKKKLPILLIFQEVYSSNDHLPIEAVSYWYEFVKIAAQGECMLLFYACECEEHNRFMKNILLEACEIYPVDRTRVYVTGYSHNCRSAVQFAYENPELVTAVAGGAPGMNLMGTPPQRMDSALQELAKIDMPCIHAMGCCEHMCPAGEPTFERSRHLMMIKHNALIAGNCEPKTLDDFRAAFQSRDKATRMTFVPNDHSEVIYLEGVEHYIADVRNKNGKFHLRFLAIENAPHNPFPTMQMLEWSYIRRFARDAVSHEIVELY